MSLSRYKLLVLSLIPVIGFGAIEKALIRPEIQTIVSAIAKENILNSKGVGFAGEKTKQWERFKKLSDKCTINELALLTSYKNATVRCYAFEALASKSNSVAFPILLKHLEDTVTVQTFQGCIRGSEKAGEYFFYRFHPNSRQKKLIDSILLYDKDIRLLPKYGLIEDLKPIPKYYNRIREIVITEKGTEAILALARYKNPNDIDLIKTQFKKEQTEYYGIYGAREFPNNVFYPYLTKIFDREWKEKLYDYSKWRILYQALAKYPSQQTFKLFEKL